MTNKMQNPFKDPAKYEVGMAKIFPGYEQLPLIMRKRQIKSTMN